MIEFAALGNHLSGRIETFDVVDLIQWLEVRRVSGRLTLRRGEDVKKIDWKNGDIVFVSGERLADRLGFTLLRSKQIPVSALYAALARNLSSGMKLTWVILEEGTLARETLAQIAESIAERVLREVLTWRWGRFDFDPGYATEDVLQIHLRVKGQVIAFQAAKELDDTLRVSRGAPSDAERSQESWEKEFRPEAVEESFWDLRLKASAEDSDPEKERERFFLFRGFAEALHSRLVARLTFFPIYEDTARYATEILERGDLGSEGLERLIGLVNLDPFWTINLLILANSLTSGSMKRVMTSREALRRIGPEAFLTLSRCLVGAEQSKLSSNDSVHRILRRAGLAAAVAASRGADHSGVDSEEAHAAGLLHVIPYADLLETIQGSPLPAGDFRLAALEHFRPIIARVRTEAWRLPPSLEGVLSDAGGRDCPPLAEAIRAARRAFPGCALGRVPQGGPRKATSAAPEARAEVRRLFDLLSLGIP
jgi:hypothetical protein